VSALLIPIRSIVNNEMRSGHFSSFGAFSIPAIHLSGEAGAALMVFFSQIFVVL
jgi:hypothetical protein